VEVIVVEQGRAMFWWKASAGKYFIYDVVLRL
jgi:hypothetical protein